MALVEDDDVIQTFTADRTDETLSVRVLPRRSWRGDDFRDAHRSNAMAESRTIRFVAVSQQITGCGVPRKGLGHLARKPILRGIWRDREVDYTSAIETEHDQAAEQVVCRRRVHAPLRHHDRDCTPARRNLQPFSALWRF